MDGETLIKFNSTAIRSKGELLEALQEYTEKLRSGNSASIPGGERRSAALLDLLEAFIEKVDAAAIPTLDQPFFAYEVRILDTEITLEMNEFTKIVYDEAGDMAESEASVTQDIVHIEAEFMPIEEFANQQQVKPATVRQWIRRGKLRNVAKRGSNWYVASTAIVNKRGYENGAYSYIGKDGDLSSVFPLPKGTHSVEIFRDYSSTDAFDVFLSDHADKTIERLCLNRSTLEKLEHALIAHPDVCFQGNLIDAITEKVVHESDSTLKCNLASKERLRIMQAAVSSDVRALLLLIEEFDHTRALLPRAYELLGIDAGTAVE